MPPPTEKATKKREYRASNGILFLIFSSSWHNTSPNNKTTYPTQPHRIYKSIGSFFTLSLSCSRAVPRIYLLTCYSARRWRSNFGLYFTLLHFTSGPVLPSLVHRCPGSPSIFSLFPSSCSFVFDAFLGCLVRSSSSTFGPRATKY